MTRRIRWERLAGLIGWVTAMVYGLALTNSPQPITLTETITMLMICTTSVSLIILGGDS